MLHISHLFGGEPRREDNAISVVVCCGRCCGISFGSYALAQDAPDEKGPPLPFHTIEGVGGGGITPMAYLVNPAKEGDFFGKPAVAATYIGLGRKNLDALTITENLFGRVELGFAADRLGLGTLPYDIYSELQAVPLSINNSDVWLYNFNVRGLIVKENANDTKWVPAITIGADLKHNADIQNISDQLPGVLTGIGYGTTPAWTLRSRQPRPCPRRSSDGR